MKSKVKKTQICLPLYGEVKSNSCTLIRMLVINKILWAKFFSESQKKKNWESRVTCASFLLC